MRGLVWSALAVTTAVAVAVAAAAAVAQLFARGVHPDLHS
jgi:hypothetical protein